MLVLCDGVLFPGVQADSSSAMLPPPDLLSDTLIFIRQSSGRLADLRRACPSHAMEGRGCPWAAHPLILLTIAYNLHAFGWISGIPMSAIISSTQGGP